MKIIMIEPRQKIEDFIILPRKMKHDYLEGKLSRNELDVLLWIWLNANPVNGYFTADYKALEREFHNRISYDNIRKIISSLRKKQYIYFLNHKGRKGSFSIYPIGFYLKNKEIQNLDYIKTKLSITTQSQSKEQLNTKLEHKLEGQYHNFKEQKNGLIKRFSIKNRNPQITTPYNDNDNKNNNIIVNKKVFNESFNHLAYKKEIIPVNTFSPKNYKEQRCWEIAKALGEKDMRYLLSRLKIKGGFNAIERVWGNYREDAKKGGIKNPPAYFNNLLEKELGLKKQYKVINRSS